MININEIKPGVISYPCNDYLRNADGCVLTVLPKFTHPMLCIQVDQHRGVWVTLTKQREARGRNIAVPSSWKTGLEGFVSTPTNVWIGQFTHIIPHDVMSHATAIGEPDGNTIRNRITATGVQEILKQQKAAGAALLPDQPLAAPTVTVAPKPAAEAQQRPRLSLAKPASLVRAPQRPQPQAKRRRLTGPQYAEITRLARLQNSPEEIARVTGHPLDQVHAYLKSHTTRLTKATTGKKAARTKLATLSSAELFALATERKAQEDIEIVKGEISALLAAKGLVLDSIKISRAEKGGTA